MIDDFGTSKVTIKKSELLEKLSLNRAQHQQEFEQAWTGYIAAAREKMQQNLALLNALEEVHLKISIPTPKNHVKEYDRVILMLEMSVADVISISEEQFVQYVQDEWIWKGAFAETRATYSTPPGR